MRKRINHKQGAAAFYIVAISTLILVIIATSFAAVIISEVTRTSNDDLAQSAYDSALAGIEDAKRAFSLYQECISTGLNDRCNEIKEAFETRDCNMVAKILGKGDREVVLEETASSSGDKTNNMNQAYTCVKINTDLMDYRANLSESNPSRVVQVKMDDRVANGVKWVKISWYSNSNRNTGEYKYNLIDGEKVSFNSLNDSAAAVPPMISVGLVQTGGSFSVDDFAETKTGETNRGLIYLVPTNEPTIARKTVADNYIGAMSSRGGEKVEVNYVTVSEIVKSNDHTVKNLPFVVYCGMDGDFLCSAFLELPKPLGGNRIGDTFMFVVGLPYGTPATDFALEFSNGDLAISDIEGGESFGSVPIGQTQLSIDSTGRANNLYRRIETRMEPADTYNPYPLFALELLGEEGGLSLRKAMTVTCEIAKFDGSGCP